MIIFYTTEIGLLWNAKNCIMECWIFNVHTSEFGHEVAVLSTHVDSHY